MDMMADLMVETIGDASGMVMEESVKVGWLATGWKG